MYSVEVQGLVKRFGPTLALDALSFSVDKGELFGFIGPDGAGKSTLFRILTTLILPDEGTCLVEGADVVKGYRQIRKIAGYMPGKFSLYPDLSVEENLGFFATIFGTTIRENYELIRDIYVQIEPFRDRPAGKLSGGMKQKLALCCALIHKPVVMFLDEPTTGVDAVSRREFWDMLGKLRDSGITILVSTPYMDEARLCDRVALVQGGRILSTDTPENISGSYRKSLLAVRASDMYLLVKDLRDYQPGSPAYLFGEEIHFSSERAGVDIPAMERYLESRGHHDIRIRAIAPNIEDCFMALMETNKGELLK